MKTDSEILPKINLTQTTKLQTYDAAIGVIPVTLRIADNVQRNRNVTIQLLQHCCAKLLQHLSNIQQLLQMSLQGQLRTANDSDHVTSFTR